MKPLARITELCQAIRRNVAAADLSSEAGICDMLASLRLKLDAIEHQARIAENAGKKCISPRFFPVRTATRTTGTVNIFRVAYMSANKILLSTGEWLTLTDESFRELARYVAPATYTPGNTSKGDGNDD